MAFPADELYRLLTHVRLNKPELEAEAVIRWYAAVGKADRAYNCIQLANETLDCLGKAEVDIETAAIRTIAVLE